jgi:hypothetical protein
MTDPFTPPDAGRARAAREWAALMRIAERHAATPEARGRQLHESVPDPYEALRLVVALAGGAVSPDPGEPEVDTADLTAALTLITRIEKDLEEQELALLTMARGRGLTWQAIAHGLGLGTAQAAKQRFERLSARAVRPEAG